MGALSYCDDCMHAHAQVTALGPPNLLERMSFHLTQQGDTLDRGAASTHLRDEFLHVLTMEELQALDRMLGRLHLLASQCHAKVGSQHTVPASACSKALCKSVQ